MFLARGLSLSCLFSALAALVSPAAMAVDCVVSDEIAAAGDSGNWNGWGRDARNTRQVPAGEGLERADLAGLELAWAFGFPGVSSVIGQPTVYLDRVLIGVDSGEVYALDIVSGCVHWVFRAAAGVRTAPVVARVDERFLVYVGDLDAQVHALDFATGEPVWQVEVEEHPAARITGSPVYHARLDPDGGLESRLYVPLSSSEEGMAGNPAYPCCSFRGSVVALDAGSGRQLWKTWTIAEEARETAPGRFGPSGAAVWSAPTLDPERGLLYVATGDAYSAPADEASDAVLALDMESGERRWLTQSTAGDIWTVACLRPGAPEDCGPDHDFGAPPILADAGERERLIAGQKSGNVWAYDPDSGALLWRSPLVEDTSQFGGKIVWGGASDGRRAWFGLGSGGIGAVSLSDGALLWFRDLAPEAGREAQVGHDGPLSLSGDLLFSGGWDGVLRVLSADDGEELWRFDTRRDFATVNGEPATGGSIGAAGPVLSGKRLLVPSGYVGVKNGMPGNVLLMFE